MTVCERYLKLGCSSMDFYYITKKVSPPSK
ncbi:hypothetical protein CEXT_436811, partial [Caerostris extrusa]